MYTGPEWYPQDVLADGETDSSYGYIDLEPSTATDRLGAVIETVEALPSFTAELKNKDTGEVVSGTQPTTVPRRRITSTSSS